MGTTTTPRLLQLYLHDDGPPDHMVHGAVVKLLLDVEVEVIGSGADGSDQLGDVVGVQRAGLGGQAAGQVGEAHVGHALEVNTTGGGQLCLLTSTSPTLPFNIVCNILNILSIRCNTSPNHYYYYHSITLQL